MQSSDNAMYTMTVHRLMPRPYQKSGHISMPVMLTIVTGPANCLRSKCLQAMRVFLSDLLLSGRFHKCIILVTSQDDHNHLYSDL